MRVIHIINSLITAGAEKLVLDTLPKYVEQGIQIELILLNGHEFPFLEKLREVRAIRIHQLSRNSLYNPLFVFRLIPLVKDADIVHVHLFPAQYWVAIAKVFGRSKARFVFTEHNTWNRRIGNRLFRLVDRQIYKRYDKIVCISEEIKQILLKHTGAAQDRFVVIENGVDLSAIKEAKPLDRSTIHPGLKDSDNLLLMTAAFREQKDHQTLIRAISHFGGSVKLLLVGDGPQREECEALTKSLQLDDYIYFLGWRMDVPSILKTSDIVILSSHYEGLSLSSIEGLGSGRPFVASDVPGLSEIVSGAGVLFPLGDDKSLATKINELLADEAYYKTVSDKCLERAEQFNIDSMVTKHIVLYNSLSSL